MRKRLLQWLHDHFEGAPPWLIPDQTTLVGVGFLACAAAAVWMARRARLDLRHVAMGLSLAFIGALAGARLFSAAVNYERVLNDPTVLFSANRLGSVSFGALLGGCLALWSYIRYHRLDLWRYADALAPAAGIGVGFARLGCFAHGCDYGRITDWGWGIRYSVEAPAFRGHLSNGFVGPYQLLSLPVHPFQLLLSGWDFLIFLVFAAAPRLGSGRAGRRALMVGGAYFGGRFVLEFLRSPYTSPMVGFLNLSQWMCATALVVLYILSRRRGADDVSRYPLETTPDASPSEA